MTWRELLGPVEMQRVALVAPVHGVRPVLVEVADDGVVALDDPTGTGEPVVPTAAAEALTRAGSTPSSAPCLARDGADVGGWEAAGRVDLLAGEAQLEAHAAGAVRRGRVAGWAGWMPRDRVPLLADRIAGLGGAVIPLARPRGVDPPTLLPETTVGREFGPLVETYATVPYADVNPAVLAGLAYVAMFGMMFADAGHGALLLLAALAIRRRRIRRLERLAPYWGFLAGAGVASMVCGALYGEFFGPTGVLPVLWLSPLEEPVTLLLAAVGVGAVLLACAYALGAVNRYREGGWRLTAYAPSGLAGATLFVGLGAAGCGAVLGASWLVPLGLVVAVAGCVAVFMGLLASSGGRIGGAAQAAIELFDVVVRLGSNLASFARLAAFGLTHAALGAVIWQACTALGAQGPPGVVVAVLVFAVGNLLTFTLEGVVAAVQALRLEYYELFSRVFRTEGRPFRPWHVAVVHLEVPCLPG